MRTVSNLLATEAQRSYNFFSATYPDRLVTKVYLTGGAARSSFLKEILAEKIGVEVEIFDPNSAPASGGLSGGSSVSPLTLASKATNQDGRLDARGSGGFSSSWAGWVDAGIMSGFLLLNLMDEMGMAVRQAIIIL